MGSCGGTKPQKAAAKTPLAQSTATPQSAPCKLQNPKLKVLVTRVDTGAGVAGIKVLAKPSAREMASADTTGLADFALVDPATYAVEGALTALQKKKFKDPLPLPGEALAKGDDKTLSLPLLPVVMLRVVLLDRADKAVKDAAWTLTAPAKTGTTLVDGLIEVDVSDLAKNLIEDSLDAELSVTFPAPAPVAPPAPGTPPAATVYPQPIKPADFRDTAPVARELTWKFKLSLVEIEEEGAAVEEVKSGTKARLVNLGFFLDGTDATTKAAVKGYQTMYKKTPVNGTLASINDDIRTRHDTP